MANYIKREIDNFEYNKKYYVLNEHKWCFMKDDDEFKKYMADREEYLKRNIQKTQADLELTGQIGDYKGNSSSDTGDSEKDDPITE